MSDNAPRNYVVEIAAAYRAEDLDLMLSIAMELAGRVQHDDARLAAQAARQRRSRENRASREVTQGHSLSRDWRDPLQGFPTPLPKTPSTPTTTAREGEAKDALVIKARSLLIEKLGSGEAVVALVDRFAAAIPGGRVHPWLTGIVTWMEPPTGGKGIPADIMAITMTDWLLADRERWSWEARSFRAFAADVLRQRDKPASAARTSTRPAKTPPQQQSYPKATESEDQVKWQK